jgi:guanyl-specific ribonuclease Sa
MKNLFLILISAFFLIACGDGNKGSSFNNTGDKLTFVSTSATQKATPTEKPTPCPSFLPEEAKTVVRNIQRGGPFPYEKDGTVFGNYERRLPAQPRGYYREYTVTTPGVSHRGKRRIVTGGNPPVVWYYTADHYETFREFTPPAP